MRGIPTAVLAAVVVAAVVAGCGTSTHERNARTRTQAHTSDARLLERAAQKVKAEYFHLADVSCTGHAPHLRCYATNEYGHPNAYTVTVNDGELSVQYVRPGARWSTLARTNFMNGCEATGGEGHRCECEATRLEREIPTDAQLRELETNPAEKSHLVSLMMEASYAC